MTLLYHFILWAAVTGVLVWFASLGSDELNTRAKGHEHSPWEWFQLLKRLSQGEVGVPYLPKSPLDPTPKTFQIERDDRGPFLTYGEYRYRPIPHAPAAVGRSYTYSHAYWAVPLRPVATDEDDFSPYLFLVEPNTYASPKAIPSIWVEEGWEGAQYL